MCLSMASADIHLEFESLDFLLSVSPLHPVNCISALSSENYFCTYASL